MRLIAARDKRIGSVEDNGAAAREALERVAAGIHYQRPATTMVSGLNGLIATPEELANPEYWSRRPGGPARLRAALETLTRAGHRTFLEVGPGTTLAEPAAAMGRGRKHRPALVAREGPRGLGTTDREPGAIVRGRRRYRLGRF